VNVGALGIDPLLAAPPGATLTAGYDLTLPGIYNSLALRRCSPTGLPRTRTSSWRGGGVYICSTPMAHPPVSQERPAIPGWQLRHSAP